MATEDKGAGPQICQPVLYNNSGTITSAMIYAVAANGTVSLVWFGSGGATSVTGVSYDPNTGSGKWSYPAFI